MQYQARWDVGVHNKISHQGVSNGVASFVRGGLMPGSDSVTWFDVTEVTETEVGDYGTYQVLIAHYYHIYGKW